MAVKKITKQEGTLTYGKKVVMSIINLATKEITGVASLHGKGAKTEINKNKVNVDIFINVIIGYSCADIAFRVQENIKRSVESMTTFKIGTINVNVLGAVNKEIAFT